MSHQSDLDNHANQLNPEREEYWESRGLGDNDDDHDYDADNHANQLNPNNDAYWSSRGE